MLKLIDLDTDKKATLYSLAVSDTSMGTIYIGHLARSFHRTPLTSKLIKLGKQLALAKTTKASLHNLLVVNVRHKGVECIGIVFGVTKYDKSSTTYMVSVLVPTDNLIIFKHMKRTKTGGTTVSIPVIKYQNPTFVK